MVFFLSKTIIFLFSLANLHDKTEGISIKLTEASTLAHAVCLLEGKDFLS
jgi:hypothetical protein